MQLLRQLILRDPNPEDGHGDIFDPAEDDASSGGEPTGSPEPPKEGDDGEPSPPEPKKEEPKLTPEAIAAAIKQAGLGQKEERQPEYTQEDFERAFHVFHPTPELVERLGVPEEQRDKALAALAELASGVNKQAVTMASYLAQQVKEEITQRIAPLEQFRQTQAEEQAAKKFFTSNKDLQPYESLVRAVVDQMKQEGYRSETQDQAFKELATRSRKMLESAGVKLGQANPPSQPSSMPRMPSGGQGGTGGKSASGKVKGPSGMEIFD
jgi:hypothetical protein